jgi:ACS family hexuronate transporter-like MFS transporter
MFASTTLNYMDRQTISLVSTQIRESFAITEHADFGWVLSAFFMTYALFQLPAGYLVDRWDLRWSYAAAVAWWSAAAVATALAPSLWWLIACRVMLGVGESFNWPCALRVTARILPQRDRALGNGIFNSGAAVGAVVTPLVVEMLKPVFGWRGTFGVIGSAGFIWVAAWLLLGRGRRGQVFAPSRRALVDQGMPSATGSRLSPAAASAFGGVLLAGVAVSASALRFGPAAIWLGITIVMLGPLPVAAIVPARHFETSSWGRALYEVVRLRRFWILIVVSISINICWHFLVNWIPVYLKSERNLVDSTGNYLTAVTFLAADMGNLGGGWLSRRLAAMGMDVVRARKAVMSLCMLLIMVGPGLSVAQSDASAMVLLSIMAAGTAAFMANFFAFSQEVSARHTGLIVGYLGGVGNLFVAGYHPFAGMLKDMTGSFTLNFVIVGLAPLVGLAALLWGWKDVVQKRG